MPRARDEAQNDAVGDLHQVMMRYGSLLKAWRLMDKDGTNTMSFKEFCTVLADFDFDGDTIDLWRQLDVDGSGEVTLEEIEPRVGKLWSRFLDWSVSRNGGGTNTWAILDTAASNKLDRAQFYKALVSARFLKPGDEKDSQVLFDGLNLNDDPCLTEASLTFLDNTTQKSLKRKPQRQLGHRELLRQTRAKAKKIGEETLVRFRADLIAKYHNVVRAWRRALDPPGRMVLSLGDLSKSCTRLGFTGNLKALFKRLDVDMNGFTTFEELDIRAARLLASFKYWCEANFGSMRYAMLSLTKYALAQRMDTKAVWDPPQSTAEERRQEAAAMSEGEILDKQRVQEESQAYTEGGPSAYKFTGLPPLNPVVFGKALRGFGWTRDHKELFQFLDVHCAGAIPVAAALFLELWEPAEWLVADPDPRARDEVKRILLNRFGTMTHAWRLHLDSDESNHVVWQEFKAGLLKLDYTGNLAGAWRALDKEENGFIQLRHLDPESDMALGYFKLWCEKKFGSIVQAFSVLDGDKSGDLTYREFRQAIYRFDFAGHVRTLFKAIDIDDSKVISVGELMFLEDWSTSHLEHAALFELMNLDALIVPAAVKQKAREALDDPALVVDEREVELPPVSKVLPVKPPPGATAVRVGGRRYIRQQYRVVVEPREEVAKPLAPVVDKEEWTEFQAGASPRMKQARATARMLRAEVYQGCARFPALVSTGMLPKLTREQLPVEKGSARRVATPRTAMEATAASIVGRTPRYPSPTSVPWIPGGRSAAAGGPIYRRPVLNSGVPYEVEEGQRSKVREVDPERHVAGPSFAVSDRGHASRPTEFGRSATEQELERIRILGTAKRGTLSEQYTQKVEEFRDQQAQVPRLTEAIVSRMMNDEMELASIPRRRSAAAAPPRSRPRPDRLRTMA
mmetsp:Transcript_36738/g.88307  ORF Transcript_36738/g.88307 Transcript_36738/m.88307 type:complete len:908 (-) Transcript_36738:219-2942(-)